MKKIGLITFHDTANHGAALQAYATIRTITKLGYEAEVIDYSNEYREGIYSATKKLNASFKNKDYKSSIKILLAYPLINRRNSAFNKFYNEYLPLSKKRFMRNDDLRELSVSYDGIVVGSDQVWSLTNNGNDSNYFLDFVLDKSKSMSYASSFGTTRIDNTDIKKYAGILESINHISVREKTGKKIVESITSRTASVVLDPVFLLSASEWLDIINSNRKKKLNNKPYFLDYTSNVKYTKSFFSIKGTEKFNNIIKFGTSIKLSDILSTSSSFKFAASPLDFLNYIYNSELIFTSSFHGVVLSILFKKKFIVILSGDLGRDSRIIDLLEELNLSRRIFRDDMKIEEIDASIDFNRAHEKLEDLKKQSIEYLANSLNSITGERHD